MVSDCEYNNAVMQRRNEFMVDSSDMIVAVWDGSNSGTGNCVKYALKNDKKVCILKP